MKNYPDDELTLPTDTTEESLDNLLEQDNHKSTKSVLSGHTKIANEFTKSRLTAISSEENDKFGKKDKDVEVSSLSQLRQTLGFSWKGFWHKIAIGAIVLGLLIIVVASGVAAIAIDKWNNTQSIDTLISKPAESSVVYARDGKTELFKFYKDEKREVIKIADIPESMQLAVVAMEDENFFYNETGVPWSNLAGALGKCIATLGDECRGGSGLSQQLVKKVTGNDDRSLDRKITELFTAIKLNQDKTNKYEILELYINWVPYGRSSFGVQEAAKSYFGKNAKDLDVVESCYLGSMFPQPEKFAVSLESGEQNPDGTYVNSLREELEARKNICLKKLHTKQLKGTAFDVFIKTEEELNTLIKSTGTLGRNDAEYTAIRAAKNIPFTPKPKSKFDTEFPHFRDFVINELPKLGLTESQLNTRGYKIITTLDPDKQREIEKIVKQGADEFVIPNGGDNASAVILDGPTGEIVAMVGSLGYDREDIQGKNNIMDGFRQPGSSIKPYVYATALSKGFNPGTVVVDAKTDFGGGFSPGNYETGRYYGPVSLRKAIQGSLNLATVKTACIAAGEGATTDSETCAKGITQVFDFGEQAGLRFPCYPPTDNFNIKDSGGEFIRKCDKPETAFHAYRDRCGLATAIGGCEVNGIAHATGINTLLQDGNLRTASPFISIKDSTGKEIYTGDNKQNAYPVQDKAIDPLIAKQMQNILSDYDARRYTFGSLAKNLELPEEMCRVAAKTGTTDKFRDAWTVGGCSNYTSVLWVGRTDNKPMYQTASAGNAAAPIWKRMMVYLEQDALNKNQKPKPFNTDGLIETRINGQSEVITPLQKQKLDEANKRFAQNDYNPNKHNIFDNRSAVISSEISINKVDGKLATPETLPENIEKKTCLMLVAEFPDSPNWANPINAYKQNYCILPELSDQKQLTDRNKEPEVISNIGSNTPAPSQINITASTPSGKAINKIELNINGTQGIYSSQSNTGSLSFNTSSVPIGIYNIEIKVTDSQNIIKTVNYTSVQIAGLPTINKPTGTINSAITLGASITPNLATNPTFKITQGSISKACTGNVLPSGYSCILNNLQTDGIKPGDVTITFIDNSSNPLPQVTINSTIQ
jgi:membrane peptidoglycan carboxypeptidase